MNTLR